MLLSSVRVVKQSSWADVSSAGIRAWNICAQTAAMKGHEQVIIWVR